MRDYDWKETRRTSLAVYHRIKRDGTLSRKRMEVLDILWEHGPMTAMEISQHIAGYGNPDYRHNTHSRLNELRERKVVFERTERECTATGNLAIEWEITGRSPVEPQKKLKTCAWARASMFDYSTACGETFAFSGAKPTNFKYCPFCGKKIP